MEWFLHLPPWVEQSSYFIVFSLLFFCGLGLPLPEEASFLLGGFLVNKINGSLNCMTFFAILGVLLGDSVLFFLAKRHGPDLLRLWPFSIVCSEARLERGRKFFQKHGSKTVFLAGFVAGLRAPTFFLSASMGVPFYKFLFWDSTRTFLTCPVSVWFGYCFGPYAQERLSPYKHYLFIVLGTIIAFFVFRSLFRRWKAKDASKS